MTEKLLKQAQELRDKIQLQKYKLDNAKNIEKIHCFDSITTNYCDISIQKKQGVAQSKAISCEKSNEYVEDSVADIAFKTFKAILISGYDERLKELEKEFAELSDPLPTSGNE